MATSTDVIIAGLGAMGSATALHVARRGVSVRGFDRFSPPHRLGSSHGQTRIIREAYFEDPAYVPIVQRAYRLWSELESEASTRLLLKTGGLMIGRPESEVISGARLSAQRHQLEHEVLSAAEITRRFPCLTPEPDMIGVYETRAGILFPEACVGAHLKLARSHGAAIHPDEPLLSWKATNAGVSVRTGRAIYHGQRLIIVAGPWAGELLGDLMPPLSVERQVQFWFDPVRAGGSFRETRCPVHLWQFNDDERFYAFPNLGEGVKIARHHNGAIASTESVQRAVDDAEISDMRALIRRFLPDAEGAFRAAAVCLYTNTPDGHFWIDRHPAHSNVLIASPCSGHGFKFSSAIGEVLADLATGQTPPFNLSLFETRWPLGVGR